MAIIKSNELLTDYDDKQFIYNNQFYHFENMVQFIDFEIFPKLRDDSLADHNVTYFF